MAGSFTLPTVLANLTAGNQPLSLIDGDLTTLATPLLALNTFSNYYTDTGAANAYQITVSSPQTVSQAAGLQVQFLATNANTGASTLQINALAVKNIVHTDGSILLPGDIPAAGLVTVIYDGTSYQLQGRGKVTLRDYIAGLTMSTAGGSGTMAIAAGVAVDSTNVDLMTLSAAISKTTGAWAVGSGNGGIDAGSIANTTWYHFYAIKRLDTGVVDVLFSTSATAPTMPANYTLKRRIGSGLTDGSAHWLLFFQDGDRFKGDGGQSSGNTTNPGTSAILSSVAVPTGVNVVALISSMFLNVTSTNSVILFTDPAQTDTAPDGTANFSYLTATAAAAAASSGEFQVRTNTSGQIRYRVSASGAADIFRVMTKGWIDSRGQNS